MSNAESVTGAQSSEQIAHDVQAPPAKTRRAFVACEICRDRKIKCVMLPYESSCQQCKESGNKCLFRKRSVKRRRSEDETEKMDRRLEVLELLISKSTAQNTTDNPLPARLLQGPAGNRASQQGNSDSFPDVTRINSNENRACSQHAWEAENLNDATKTLLQRSKQNGMEDSILSQLLSKTGRLNADAGRLRYFGPSTSLYIYDSFHSLPVLSDPSPAEKDASRMIGELSGETHAHILEQYWKFYNSIIEVVPKEPFLEGHSTDNSELYSVSLHLTMLALGLRFVDKERPDICKLMVSPYESIFHLQAKLLIESELERRGRLPSIQALLLLSDLECGSGKDMMGWMYAGMACRLFFDLGLNLDSFSLGLSSWEAEVRQKVSIACLMIDRCWSLFFVRPTCIKKGDLEAASIFKSRARSYSISADVEKTQQPIVYEAVMSLMDIASKVGDSNATRTTEVDASSHMTMLILHGEIERWYKSLHPAITWEPENIQNATAGFFLLHQQYHAIRIILHRPFVSQTGARSASSPVSSSTRSSFVLDSGDICLESGLQLAKILMVSSSRFNIRLSFITAMQHAGTAVRALVEVIASTTHPEHRREAMQHLLYLKFVLFELGHIYQHASRMHRVVDMVLQESGWEAEYQALGQAMEEQEAHPPVPSTKPDIARSQKSTSAISSLDKISEKYNGVLGHNFDLEATELNEMWNFSCEDLCDGSVDVPLRGATRNINLTDWFPLRQVQ